MRQDQTDSVMTKERPKRQPDFHVHALDQTNEARARIGAAWKNDDGSISIRLDPFVVLTAAPTLLVRLFINDGKLHTAVKAPRKGSQNEIPF